MSTSAFKRGCIITSQSGDACGEAECACLDIQPGCFSIEAAEEAVCMFSVYVVVVCCRDEISLFSLQRVKCQTQSACHRPRMNGEDLMMRIQVQPQLCVNILSFLKSCTVRPFSGERCNPTHKELSVKSSNSSEGKLFCMGWRYMIIVLFNIHLGLHAENSWGCWICFVGDRGAWHVRKKYVTIIY